MQYVTAFMHIKQHCQSKKNYVAIAEKKLLAKIFHDDLEENHKRIQRSDWRI